MALFDRTKPYLQQIKVKWVKQGIQTRNKGQSTNKQNKRSQTHALWPWAIGTCVSLILDLNPSAQPQNLSKSPWQCIEREREKFTRITTHPSISPTKNTMELANGARGEV